MAGRPVAAAAIRWISRGRCRCWPFLAYPNINGYHQLKPRLYGTTPTANATATAIQMVNYARSRSRGQNATLYPEALRVLEQGLSIFQGGDISTANAAGRLLLAMATLHTNRGDFTNAVERLQQVSDITLSPIEMRVVALEAITGLYLRMHQDLTASDYGDRCLQLVNNAEIEIDGETMQVLEMRAKAIKGLVELAQGRLDSAETYFAGCTGYNIKRNRDGLGAVALSHAEFVHAVGNFPLAQQLYDTAMELSGTGDRTGMSVPAAAAMDSEEVQLGAACGLGQLATHSGNFEEAEKTLTDVLKKTEDQYGTHNPKVGIILFCIADMFGHKGNVEGANYFFIQEGLFRRALEMLKAPPLDQKGPFEEMDARDVTALVRGSYAQLLSHQHNRKGEAERMREWADAIWNNCHTSLAQVLQKMQTSKHKESAGTDTNVVIDMRLGRIF